MTHMKRTALALAVGACVLSVAWATPLSTTARVRSATAPDAYAQASGSRLLALSAGVFDPRSETLIHPWATLKPPGGGRYAIVQFADDRVPDADWLRAQGARVVGYVPNHAFLVEAPASLRTQLRADARVRFVGAWEPAFKIAEGLDRVTEAEVALDVLLFRGERAAALASSVAALSGDTRPVVLENSGWPRLRIAVPQSRLAQVVGALAALDAVQWIERYDMPHTHNANAVWPIQANQAAGANPIGNAPIWAQDITGTGQIVAVADSGLDRNEGWFTQLNGNTEITNSENTNPPTPGTVYPARKIYGYFSMPGASPYDDNATCPGGSPTSFHGTHTSGSVAGDSGTASTPTDPGQNTGDGMAPNAQLLFQDIGNDSSGCLSGLGGLPMWQQAKAAGAYISSNSYGSAYANAPFYTAGDAEVDQTLWLNEDMLIAFSAGNEGSAATTIGHPGHSKHALTVGALGNGNSTTVATFSSRGPTSDGRRKPDIMAPGSSIVSAAGDDNDTTVDAPTTATLSGTSMSTPIVAGGAALMRQYFVDGFYPTGVKTPANARRPLGSELKALLLNGTAFITTTPSNNYGWGRIWLDNNLYFPGDARDLRTFARRQESGLSTGQQHEYQVQVGAGQEFRATLVWYDPPGTPGAAGTALVNNLDLEVSDGVNLYRGNVLSGSGAAAVSVTGGTADVLNPVEQVRLTAPTAGVYTVRVKATAVPGDGQAYSNRQGYGLAVSGAQCATAVTAAPATLGASNSGGAVQLTAASVAGATAYQAYRANGTCASANAGDFQLVAHGNGPTLTDDRAQGGYTYAYKVRAVDACGEGPISSCTDIASTALCTLYPTFNQASVTAAAASPGDCAVRIQWSAGASNCPLGTNMRYNIYRSTDPLFVPAAANRIATGVSGTEFVDNTAASLTTYHYVVRAEDSTSGNGGPSGGNESLGSVRVSYTPAGTSSPGTFVDGADSPAFLSLGAPWAFSNDRAATGTYSYRSAADGASTYTPDTCGAITSPALTLQAGAPVLSFKARYNLESTWDGVVVEISTDNGNSWSDLPPDGGYPSSFSSTGSPPLNACGYAASHGAFSGTSGGVFSNYTRTLAAFAGQTVRLRWRFSSDPGSEEEGFYLDDVQVTNASAPSACSAGGLFANGFE